MMKRDLFRQAIGISLFSLFLTARAFAGDPTAFDLAKEGNRYVGELSKDKIVKIHSDKSVGSLTPKIWYVTYFDETATMKSVEVKFVAGKMADVRRPVRLIARIRDKVDPMDHKKLKIDSDKAISIATKESILEHITVTATAPELEEENAQPVWKVRLWAAKVKSPKKDADIGEIHIDAETGKVLKTDVSLKKLE
jgi:hypothetical protein